MQFKGLAQRIDDYDIPRIGAMIGVGEDELHAFMDVEAAGSGFDSKGRPKMLFEPHLFYRELGPGGKRDEAVKQGLAYAKWKTGSYPKDSYARLAKAILIDDEAALRSCSWGLTQILGKWHKDIGYATVLGMVNAFADDEAKHLEATVLLLKKWGVDDDLRAHRWASVAQAWNGPQYATHGYHLKLAAAYTKWSKIRDTVWPPKDWVPPAELTPEEIKELPAAPDKHTEVITTPGAVEGTTTVVTVDNPVNEPAKPQLPTQKTGIAVLSALILALLTAVAKYFGG